MDEPVDETLSDTSRGLCECGYGRALQAGVDRGSLAEPRALVESSLETELAISFDRGVPA